MRPGRSGPLWQGPQSAEAQGGVTQSLIQRWLTCPERFRIYTIDGLNVSEGFSHKLEYGNMFHLCEEHYAKGTPVEAILHGPLLRHAERLQEQYPMNRDDVLKWYMVCCCQFPIYVRRWAQHPDEQAKELISKEQTFRAQYILSSGRSVWLRGKWDEIDVLIDKTGCRGLWITDHKTKSDLDVAKISRNLAFDLQTMFYVVALEAEQDNSFWQRANKRRRNLPISGVFYNCIRRPLGGGKHTIKPHEPTKKNPRGESMEAYYARLTERIEGDLDFFFLRFPIELGPRDVKNFRDQCLDPILEMMCDDHEWWSFCLEQGQSQYDYELRGTEFPEHRRRHYRFPFNVYSPMMDRTSGVTPLDEYLRSGTTLGLKRVDNLFPELREEGSVA
jgi:hypothetical protein